MSNPVLITADDDGVTYLHDHLTHFFNKNSYDVINNFSQPDKERYFELITNHENMISNLFGDSITNSKIFLPAELRNGVESPLIQQYKAWLAQR
jgi:hypothetical protein